jgi:hypothetical protein
MALRGLAESHPRLGLKADSFGEGCAAEAMAKVSTRPA